MATGACCHPDCKLRKKGVIDSQEEMEFVYLEHTRPSREGPTCECPQMHARCFQSLQTDVLKVITTKTMNKEEMLKAMWDTSRQGKYDQIRFLCKCLCGGLLKPITGGRGQIVTSICGDCKPTVEKKRRQNKRPTVNFDPHKFKLLWEGYETEEECIDEDAAAFLWKSSDSSVQNMQMTKSKGQELPDMAEAEIFPDLPFSGCLPSVLRAKVQTSALRNPDITIRNRYGIICVMVGKERQDEWIGWLMGPKGSRIQRMDNEHNTITYIHADSAEYTRFVVAKKSDETTKQNRLLMAQVIACQIRKKLSRS
jgi:hypothetical protein